MIRRTLFNTVQRLSCALAWPLPPLSKQAGMQLHVHAHIYARVPACPAQRSMIPAWSQTGALGGKRCLRGPARCARTGIHPKRGLQALLLHSLRGAQLAGPHDTPRSPGEALQPTPRDGATV